VLQDPEEPSMSAIVQDLDEPSESGCARIQMNRDSTSVLQDPDKPSEFSYSVGFTCL
jgi:hypothetical protein